MPKLSELKIAITDTETTGLDKHEHEIIEIATLIYNPVTDQVEDEWETKISPTHIETADPVALEMNGYTNNPGLYTAKLKSSLIKFNSLAKDCFILGQNINFDLKFIYKAMKYFDIKPSFHRSRSLTLESLAWWEVKKAGLKRFSLQELCDHFDIPNVGSHSALVDCRRAFEVYKRLSEMY